jgi:hypothetical protein
MKNTNKPEMPRGESMKEKIITISMLVFIFISCAQVPKESVELSATIGRDLAIVHQSHRQIAIILFERMNDDVNRFIDNVYTPYQIQNVMNRQFELAMSSKPEDQRKSLFYAINIAFKPDASSQIQKQVVKGMEIFVSRIHRDINEMRNEMLDPLNLQEKEILSSIDRSYQQLHYANSIVTGHLSSVAKVHETQSELLAEIGIERDLRKEVALNIEKTSKEIGELVQKAETVDENISKAEEYAYEIKETINNLNKQLNDIKGR